MWAATKGNPEIVKLLLAKGADITKTSKEGKTALNYAMANGHKEITTILTEKQEALEANKKP
jgi:ankyrin repeat protein